MANTGKKRFNTAVALTLVFIFLFTLINSSCAKPEPPVEEVVEVAEDPHAALFDILYENNGHSANLHLRRVRGFYTDGLPSELPAKFSASQSSIDIKLTASIDSSVFGAGAEYTDFIMKLLRDASLTVNSRRDPVLKNSITNVGISLKGQRLASADVLVEGGERIGVSLGELYPTYITLDYIDLMKIISDVTHIDALGKVTYNNVLPIGYKALELFRLADINKEQTNAVTRPFYDKLSDVLSPDHITIDYGAGLERNDGAIPLHFAEGEGGAGFGGFGGLGGANGAGVEGDGDIFSLQGLNNIADSAENGYKKVSVSLASDDLRHVLTALVQTAKENAAFLSFIKEKYAVIYDFAVELNGFGLVMDPAFSDLPPVEGVDYLLNSLLSAFETMLGSQASLPFKAMAFDFYLDGTVLKSVDIKLWTSLPDGDGSASGVQIVGDDGNRPAGVGAGTGAQIVGDDGNRPVGATEVTPESRTVNSVSIVQNAGPPTLHITINSFDGKDGKRHDFTTVAFVGSEGEMNTITLSSRLAGDGAEGVNIIDAVFEGPAFDGVPSVGLVSGSSGAARAFSLYSYIKSPQGADRPLLYISGNLTEAEDGYLFTSGLGFNDPVAMNIGGAGGMRGIGASAASTVSGASTASAASTSATSASASAQNAPEPDNPYIINLRCDGRLTFGPAEIPLLSDEDVYPLVQDSFYDGTFEAIFNEFYTNLVRFASANKQILSLYGFPGF